MKRNETVLVYGVTALLVVILAIAIIFGNDGRKETDRKDLAQRPVSNLEELMGVKSARTDKTGSGPGLTEDANKRPAAPAAGGQTNPTAPGAGNDQASNPPANNQPAGNADGGAPGTEAKTNPGPVTAVALDADAARRALGVRVLGESRREREYRIVKVKDGDSLSGLVQRWTGSTESMALVAALNETLESSRLRPGQEVIVPWVEDDVILAKYEAARLTSREAANRPSPSKPVELPGTSPTRGTSSPTGGGDSAKSASSPQAKQLPKVGRDHLVQSGDSLWKIAGKHVEQKLVPAYIEQIVAANPGLNAGNLPVGKKIVLP